MNNQNCTNNVILQLESFSTLDKNEYVNQDWLKNCNSIIKDELNISDEDLFTKPNESRIKKEPDSPTSPFKDDFTHTTNEGKSVSKEEKNDDNQIKVEKHTLTDWIKKEKITPKKEPLNVDFNVKLEVNKNDVLVKEECCTYSDLNKIEVTEDMKETNKELEHDTSNNRIKNNQSTLINDSIIKEELIITDLEEHGKIHTTLNILQEIISDEKESSKPVKQIKKKRKIEDYFAIVSVKETDNDYLRDHMSRERKFSDNDNQLDNIESNSIENNQNLTREPRTKRTRRNKRKKASEHDNEESKIENEYKREHWIRSYNKNEKRRLTIPNCPKCHKDYPFLVNKCIPRQCTECETNLQYQCKLCKKQYLRVPLVYMHLDSVCNIKYTLYCDNCDYKTSIRGNLVRHMKVHDLNYNQTSYACSKCDGKYKTIHSLKKHEYYCGEKPHACCPFCHFRTKFKYLLKSHMLKQHTDEDLSDLQKIVEDIFENAKKVKEKESASLKTLTPQKREVISTLNMYKMYCSKCCMDYDKEVGNGKQKCPICAMTLLFKCLKCKSIYNSYMRVHGHITLECKGGLKPKMKCVKCNFESNRRSYLKNHLRLCHGIIFMDDSCFSCSKCGKQYCRYTALRKHEKNCTVKKMDFLECIKCSYRSQDTITMKNHMIEHHSGLRKEITNDSVTVETDDSESSLIAQSEN